MEFVSLSTCPAVDVLQDGGLGLLFLPLGRPALPHPKLKAALSLDSDLAKNIPRAHLAIREHTRTESSIPSSLHRLFVRAESRKAAVEVLRELAQAFTADGAK